MKKIFALMLSLAVIFTCFTACGGEKATDGNADASVSGETTTEIDYTPVFPDFRSETFDGKKVTQKALKGNRLTIVNVWGTFCGPCIKEMPDLERISRDYADKGVVVIGMVEDVFNSRTNEYNDDKVAKAKDIVAQTGVTYMNILSSETLADVKLDGVTMFPTTYFLNEEGEIISEYIGSRSYDDWSRLIDSILIA